MEWLLIVWLCSSPGPTGACARVEMRPQPTRQACMAARAAKLRASVHVHAACRLNRDEIGETMPPGAG